MMKIVPRSSHTMTGVRRRRWAVTLCMAVLTANAAVAEDLPRPDPLAVLKLTDVASIKRAIPVVMRDGTMLLANVIMPKGPASEHRPAILIQTPYNPDSELRPRATISRLIRTGYAVVVVNDRGTQWSEGEYHWMKGAADDGEDAIKWVTSQPWSNGKVGTLGCSSSGEVQFALAKRNPPGLKAMVAMGAATGVGVIPGYADQGVFYTGGVPLFDWGQWYRTNGHLHHPKLPQGISQTEREALVQTYSAEAKAAAPGMEWTSHLPSGDTLKAAGAPDSEFNRLITMKPDDPHWRDYDFLNAGDTTKVPMLHVDSWYDTIEIYGTAKAYEYLSKNSPNQYLIVGGGPHCKMESETEDTKVGERPIGDARFDYAGQITQWFDHWMKDDGNGTLAMPRVQYYPLESNKWVSSPVWPPVSSAKRLFLDSKGNANGLAGGGVLADVPGTGAPDHFVADPLNPVPSRGGGCCDPAVSRDQTEIEKRDDVLVYTTPAFVKPLKIAGYVKATLYFSTSVPDTDVAVKLVDVYPDGKAYNIYDTIQRLRYAPGMDRKASLKAGQVYVLHIDQMVAASHFAVGHRLRIEIAGSNFPEYERNMNTGGPNYTESNPVVAKNTVYHDRGRASFIEIPVVP